MGITPKNRQPAASKPTLTLAAYRHVTDKHAETAWATYMAIQAYADDVRDFERATGTKVPWNDQNPTAFAMEVAADRGEDTPEAPKPSRAARRAAKRDGVE